MAIIIGNNGSSIRFSSSLGDKLVLKHSIKTVSVIKHETIRLNINEEIKNLAFRHSDVVNPITGNAHELALLINTMITDCVCCKCSAGTEE